MAMFRAGFSRLLAPGFRKVTFDSYKERPSEGQKLVNMNTSKRAYEEDFEIAGFGPLQPKPEGASIIYQDIPPGNIKRYLWTTFGSGFRITQEMMEDDLYDIFGNKLSKALGKSARNNREIMMFAPLNNAFDTSVSGFVSGESLVSATHLGMRGLNHSNVLATPSDLTLPALQAAIEHFMNLTDDAGLPMMLVPKYLIHSVGDYWIANQLLKTQFLPGTQLNDINQVAKEGITPVLVHYLNDPDAWFLMADEHGINFFQRRAFAMANMDDFETGDAKFKGTVRYGSGFGSWRGIFGSPGA